MTRLDHIGLQLLGARNRCVKVLQFKPQENAISIGPKVGISDWAVLVLDIPIVQLKDQGSLGDQPLIVRSAVRALATQEVLIPAAACLDIVHANEGL